MIIKYILLKWYEKQYFKRLKVRHQKTYIDMYYACCIGHLRMKHCNLFTYRKKARIMADRIIRGEY